MASGQPTELQDPPARYEEVLLRLRPRLSWRDAAGAHDQMMEGRLVVGAAAGVDLPIQDPTVSRIHAELELRPAGLWVRDLGSRNGTFIDGVRIESACAPEGGRLRLGAVEIAVSYAPQPDRVSLWPEPRFYGLVGASTPMRELYARLSRVALSEATVLIHGETGTGKELVARSLHDASRRAGGPFVVVDCAALPETLLDAELFGHARGAFTGAAAARSGSFEVASGGTIFLDEIGELPLSLQPKLLRVLEARTIRRLGENEDRPVDVRFLSATHRDLRTMVNAGAFREDLYFRLAVLPVTVPPLRERPGDIRALAEHFLPPASRALLTPDLIAELEAKPWMGNVRELRNFVERLTALGASEALALTSPPEGEAVALSDLSFQEARDQARERFERSYVEALLDKHDRNVSAAARAAGVHRTYLYRLIQRYAL
jgi:two-component system, NtrC family, response regulator GlrR